jgi:two-component system sensor histidine kinase PhoQ
VFNTLFGRLFIVSLIVLSLFFGLIVYTVNQLSLDNVYTAKKEQLRLQNYILLSSAQIDTNSIELPDELREPRFDDYESGLYGYISDRNGEIYWSSYSAHTLKLDKALLKNQLTEPGQFDYQITADYFIYYYTVLWEIETDKPKLITFTVLEDIHPTLNNVEGFQESLQLWLAAIGLLLITILMLILRWGTKPLRQLARNLKQIESGIKENIEGHYPIELRTVTKNINELIDTERHQRERYHTTLADLAHSLKTPLAVIQTELDSHKKNSLIAEQIQRMDEIIKHQLQRAVVASSHQLAENNPVKESVDRLISAMSKVYADKNIQFELMISEDSIFKGDQRDLMEVLGNLVDNACKACHKKIKIKAHQNQKSLNIEIHDDGGGIPVAKRQQLLQRGTRADTQYSGQGIGLNVAHDIIQSYHGRLWVDQSSLGGALLGIEFKTSL